MAHCYRIFDNDGTDESNLYIFTPSFPAMHQGSEHGQSSRAAMGDTGAQMLGRCGTKAVDVGTFSETSPFKKVNIM